MRKSTRLLSQFDGLTQLPRSLFVCSTCRQHFLSFPQVAATQSHRNASGNTPFTEKLRQKIWGTKTPPGLEDPYGGESIIEKRARKRRAAAQERKGREPDVQEAETPSEEPANVSAPSSEYVPAQTWDGLEHVGLMGHWDEKPTTLEDMFHGFIPFDKITGRQQLIATLHQVAVEVFTLQQGRKDMTEIYQILSHDSSILQMIPQVRLSPSEDGKSAVLSYPSEESKQAIWEALTEPERIAEARRDQELREQEEISDDRSQGTDSGNYADAAATSLEGVAEDLHKEPSSDPDTLTSQPQAAPSSPMIDLSFLSIPLTNPAIKFAFIKRISQLTGHLIPDPTLTSLTTISKLLHHLLQASKPKPKKLAGMLNEDKAFRQLPNVKIMRRRETPIDREIEIGRWKVIERELEARGLPVTGNGKEA